MILENKNAVIYGAGGAVGSAVARAFAREGARVFLTARRPESISALASEIDAADAAVVDGFDEEQVEGHLGSVGRVDVSFNAINVPQDGVQGIPVTNLSLDAFLDPLTTYMRTHFVTARAAARVMEPQESGVILTLTAGPGRRPTQVVGAMGPMWGAVEAFTRGLAAELGPSGVRAVCIRSHGMPETPLIQHVTAMIASSIDWTVDELTASMRESTLMGRLPTLAQLGDTAAFLASDGAGSITGSVVNMTLGNAPD